MKKEEFSMQSAVANIFMVPNIKLRLFRPCQKVSDSVTISYDKIIEFISYPNYIMVFTTEGDFIVDMTKEEVKAETKRIADYTFCLN
jgi:hypothetical protein